MYHFTGVYNSYIILDIFGCQVFSFSFNFGKILNVMMDLFHIQTVIDFSVHIEALKKVTIMFTINNTPPDKIFYHRRTDNFHELIFALFPIKLFITVRR